MRWQDRKSDSSIRVVLGCGVVLIGVALEFRALALPSAWGATSAAVESTSPTLVLDPVLLPSAPDANPDPNQDRAAGAAQVPADSRRAGEPAAVKTPASPASAPSPKTWKNSLGMEFVHIEPGQFTMGSSPAQIDLLVKLFPEAKREDYSAEQPAHLVRITKPFEMGKYKVTIGEFHMFVAATQYPADADADSRLGTKPRPWFPQADDHPMVNVSWNDVHAFCDWLSAKDNGRVRYRLPTEAEWEYACRAGTTTLFPNGDDPEKLALIGNVADASAKRRYPDWNWAIKADDGYVYASPVGAFAPNAWGLYDMIGNVWEWCEDQFDATYYNTLASPCVDPTGPLRSASRAIRGGNWFLPPRRCRPADRGGFGPAFRCSFLGFRLVAIPVTSE